MKICPNRDCPFLKEYGEVAEYRDEIAQCVDCGTLLVDSALASSIADEEDNEEGADKDGNDLVVIATFDHPLQAHIHRAHLEAEGIPAFLFDEHMVTNNWLATSALGGVRLAVPTSACESAIAILSNHDGTAVVLNPEDATAVDAAELDEEIAETGETFTCLRCQQEMKYLKEYKFDSQDNNRGFFAVLFDVEERLIFDIYVCPNCKHAEFIFKGSSRWID